MEGEWMLSGKSQGLKRTVLKIAVSPGGLPPFYK